MINKKKNFFFDYTRNFNLILDKSIKDNIVQIKYIKERIKKVKKYKKKIIIFGNGGSASIASHFNVDLNNAAKINCISLNDPSLITCYSNDYGYESWVQKCLERCMNKKDIVILISSSGKSMNMIKAGKFVKRKKNLLITFTGFHKKNQLKKIGDLNVWVDSRKYNYIENIHQFILLSIVDYFNKKF